MIWWLAQLVEHRVYTEKVRGSDLFPPTILFKALWLSAANSVCKPARQSCILKPCKHVSGNPDLIYSDQLDGNGGKYR